MRDFEGKQARTWSGCEQAPVGPEPGKRTLTETLPAASAPVQRRVGAAPVMPSGPRPTIGELFGGVQRKVAGGEPDAAAIQASAGRGIATAASSLPHAETIQRSFGRHDISGIQAHTGQEAAASAQAMGAAAYATGSHVVLGGGTDLHTVAHEAAHVIQQRGGVQLKSGVGQVGDAHEQHADAVADLVVQGKSAEGLLDAYAPSSGDRGAPSGAATPGVQRRINGSDGRPLSWPEVVQQVGGSITNTGARDHLYRMWQEPGTTYTIDEIRYALGGGGPARSAQPQQPPPLRMGNFGSSNISNAPEKPSPMQNMGSFGSSNISNAPEKPSSTLGMGNFGSSNISNVPEKPSSTLGMGNFGSTSISDATPSLGMPGSGGLVPVVASNDATTASGEWSYNGTYWESSNGWSFFPGSTLHKKPDRLVDHQMKQVTDQQLMADLAQREVARKQKGKAGGTPFALLGIPRGPTRGRELDTIEGIDKNWSPGKTGGGYDNARAHWEKHPQVGGQHHAADGFEEDAKVAATASYVKHAYEFMTTNNANSFRQGNFAADGGSPKNVTIYYSSDHDTIAVFDQDMGVLRSFYDLNPSIHGYDTNKEWLRANGARV